MLFLHAFLLGTAWIFFETVADTRFLAQFGSRGLPLSYLAITAASVVAAYAYTQLESRCPPGVMAGGLLSCILLVILASRAGFLLENSRPAALATRVAYWVLYMLGELHFWALAGRLFDLRQSKRLFPLIGSGEVLASILGGFSVPWLTQFLAVPDLLYLAAGAMLLTLVLARFLLRRPAADLAEPGHADSEQASRPALSVREIAGNRYLVLLLTVYGLYLFAWYFVDFAFYNQVEAFFENDEKILADFLGPFYGCTGLVQLVGQILLASWIINRFGIRTALLVLPICIGLGSICLTLLNLYAPAAPAFFWIMAGLKLCEWVLAKSLQEPAVRVLYQPLPRSQRSAFQAFAEGIFGAAVTGLTSGVLLLLTSFAAFAAVESVQVLIGLAVLWGVASVALCRAYRDTLQRSVAQRSLGSRPLLVLDASTRDILADRLQSTDPAQVLYALNVLDQDEEAPPQDFLTRLLDHPDAAVRLEALSRIERHRIIAAAARVAKMVETEPTPDLRGRALRVLLALEGHDALDLGLAFLADSRAALREGALVGLLRYGGVEGVLAAGTDFLKMVTSPQVAERELAANVLGEVGIESFHRPLLTLLEDPEWSVRRAALTAAPRVANGALLPALLTNLAIPGLGRQAATALAACGRTRFPELELALRETTRSAEERVLLVDACRQIGGKPALALLKQFLDEADCRVRRRVLAVLLDLGFVASMEDRPKLLDLVWRDCQRATQCLAALKDTGAGAGDPLAHALFQESRHQVADVLMLCCFLYPSTTLRDARTRLTSASSLKRALAVELLEQVLPQEIKQVLLPLVEDLPALHSPEGLPPSFPQESLIGTDRLAWLLRQPWLHPWTRSCVLYHVGNHRLQGLEAAVADNLVQQNAMVRETAEWAARRLMADAATPLTDIPEGAPQDSE